MFPCTVWVSDIPVSMSTALRWRTLCVQF